MKLIFAEIGCKLKSSGAPRADAMKRLVLRLKRSQQGFRCKDDRAPRHEKMALSAR